MAYCSLVVNAGSYNDPPHRQGLAHFLEHMIFMGSSKYASASAYSDHISSQGGYWNAYTEFEITNYQFQVPYQGLEKAIDMQANNFAAPLLLKETMMREINAIDNEFQGILADDSTRAIQVLKENTASPDHILNTFQWGNLKSLQDDDADELWDDLW